MYKKPFSSDSAGVKSDMGAATPPFQPELPKSKWLAQIANNLAHRENQDANAIYLLMLTGVASALGGNTYVALRTGYRFPLLLYGVAATIPGKRKSDVVDCVKQPLITAMGEIRDEFRQYESNVELCAERYKGLKARARKVKTDAERAELALEMDAIKEEFACFSMPEIIFFDEITPVGLIELLSKTKYAFHISDEPTLFSGWLNLTDERIRVFINPWLKGHGGYITKLHGNKDYSGSALNMVAFVQPGIIHNLFASKKLRGSGLIDRLLVRNAEQPTTTLPLSSWHNQTLPYFQGVIREMFESWYGKKTPPERVIRLTPEAEGIYDSFFSMCMDLQSSLAGRPAEEATWLSKFPGQLMRVAGVLHCFQNHPELPEAVPLNEETMLEAREFLMTLKWDMEGYHYGHRAQNERIQELMQKIISKLSIDYPNRSEASFSVRDVYRLLKSEPEDTVMAMNILASQNILKMLPVYREAGKAGRDASARYAWYDYVDPMFRPQPHYSGPPPRY